MVYPNLYNPDGSPDVNMSFLGAVVLCALYNHDQKSIDDIAFLTGGRLDYYSVNPNTYQPDVAVFTDANRTEALVFMAGTTNSPQLLGHVAGSIAPTADLLVPINPIGNAQVNLSFLLGNALVEPSIDAVIATIGTGKVKIFGHSYGAATGHILARHLANSTPRPSSVQLMTFGQPRTYDGREARSEPDYYARIINSGEPGTYSYENFVVDPVCTSPPAIIQLARVGTVAKLLQKFLGFFWAHHGEPWILLDNSFVKPLPAPLGIENLPFVNLFQFSGNAQFLSCHWQQVYLQRILASWKLSGSMQGWQFLESYANKYLIGPSLGGTLTPLLTATQLNQNYFDPSTQPVTQETRSEWQLVSASGFFISESGTSALGGNGTVSLFKGTMAFNSVQGGWSESLYAKDPTMTASRMLSIMDGAMAKRCRLSVTQDNSGCNNPIMPVFVRVEDTLVQRDAISVSESGIRPGFTTGTMKDLTQNQNMDLQLGPRIKYFGGGPRQVAYVVHHGLPLYAYDGIMPASGGQFGSAFRRYPSPNSNWLTQLRNYVGYMAQNGLGFRTITGAWNDPLTGAPLAYASPTSWYYNPTMQMVELQWATAGTGTNPPFFPSPIVAQQPANWPNVNSLCRLQVRKWKSFAVLAGRWAAQVVTPQTGMAFALRILRRCRNPNVPTDNVPIVSPIAWSVWYPGETTNPPSLTPSGNPSAPGTAIAGTFVLVEDKNLGKNFDVERGRQRNRPT